MIYSYNVILLLSTKKKQTPDTIYVVNLKCIMPSERSLTEKASERNQTYGDRNQISARGCARVECGLQRDTEFFGLVELMYSLIVVEVA